MNSYYCHKHQHTCNILKIITYLIKPKLIYLLMDGERHWQYGDHDTSTKLVDKNNWTCKHINLSENITWVATIDIYALIKL